MRKSRLTMKISKRIFFAVVWCGMCAQLLSSQLSRSSNGSNSSSGGAGSGGGGECFDLLRYRLAMPVHQIQVRTVIGDPSQRHAVWEIAYCRLDNCNRPCKTVYQFLRYVTVLTF